MKLRLNKVKSLIIYYYTALALAFMNQHFQNHWNGKLKTCFVTKPLNHSLADALTSCFIFLYSIGMRQVKKFASQQCLLIVCSSLFILLANLECHVDRPWEGMQVKQSKVVTYLIHLFIKMKRFALRLDSWKRNSPARRKLILSFFLCFDPCLRLKYFSVRCC